MRRAISFCCLTAGLSLMISSILRRFALFEILDVVY